MNLEQAIAVDREVARLGALLADHGHPDGTAIRRRALQSGRRHRRKLRRRIAAERIAFGYLDLGGEAGGA